MVIRPSTSAAVRPVHGDCRGKTRIDGAGLLTRVGAALGRFIREELAREGVDVRGVLTDPARLTALVVLGIRNRESFPLIFYRENCADMALCEQDLDEAHSASTRAGLINGTHLSTPSVFAASAEAKWRVKAQWRTCGVLGRGLPGWSFGG